MTNKLFKDMSTAEKIADIEDRCTRFTAMQLPGQPQGMHLGTSYLINDMRSLIRLLADAA